VPLSFAAGEQGILPDRMIAELVRDGAITPARPLAQDQIQPASLDLRLGAVAYRVRASFLPGPRTLVGDRIQELTLHEIALGSGAVLETGCVYVVPRNQRLDISHPVSGIAKTKN
jgi:dCTP deaminase